MNRLLTILILCWVLQAHSQEYKRVECNALVDSASEAIKNIDKVGYSKCIGLIDSFNKKYTIYSNPELHLEETNSLVNYFNWMYYYSELNRQTGNYTIAEHTCDEIINASIKYNDISGSKERAYLNRLNIWLRQGKYTEIINVITSQQESLPNDVDSKTKAKLILAEAYYNRNLTIEDTKKAIDILTALLEEHKPQQDATYIKVLNSLGLMYSGLPNDYLNTAYAYLSEGLEKIKSDDTNYYIILSNLAYTEGRLGKYSDALSHIDEVIKWQEHHQGLSANTTLSSYWKKAEILLMKASHNKDTKKITVVRAYKNYFKKEKDYILHNFASMTEHERLSFWAAQYELLTSCYSVADVNPKFAYEVALFAKNIQLQATYNTRKYQNDRGSNQLYQTFCQSMTMTSNDVRKQLATNDVAIEWIMSKASGDSTYTALVLHKNGRVNYIPVISKRDLRALQFKKSRKTINVDYALACNDSISKSLIYNNEQLGHDIWDSIMTSISPNARIYFSPTELLNIFAIEYLPQYDSTHIFFRLSSTGELCRKRNTIPLCNHTLLIGGVDYYSYKQDANTNVNAERSSSRVLKKKLTFAPLEGSFMEVDSINYILNDSLNVCLKKGSNATERFVKDSIAYFNITHLSTHGFCLDFGNTRLLQRDSLMQDQLMTHSGLALAGANYAAFTSPNTDDGLLTAKEISELDLTNTRLVVLSACQTAVGKITDEEVASISRGFKKAGVQAMIVSLWSTGDVASQIFFTEFYRYLKEDTQHSIRNAFDKARRHLRNEKNTSTRINLNQVKYYDSYILLDAFQ